MMLLSRKYKFLSIPFILSIVVSCGRFEEVYSTVMIRGKVQAGPVRGATVDLFSLNPDGSTGEYLSRTQTDETGAFTASLTNTKKYSFILAVATGGTYINEASQKEITLVPGESFQSIVEVNNSAVSVPISPLTDMVAKGALENKKSRQGSLEKKLDEFSSLVEKQFGLKERDLKAIPLNPSPSLSAITSEARVAIALTSLSQTLKNLNIPDDKANSAYQAISSEVARIKMVDLQRTQLQNLLNQSLSVYTSFQRSLKTNMNLLGLFQSEEGLVPVGWLVCEDGSSAPPHPKGGFYDCPYGDAADDEDEEEGCSSPDPFESPSIVLMGFGTVRGKKIDGGWSEWSQCDDECKQYRSCNNPYPSCGGNECEGEKVRSCPDTAKIDGGWSEWTQCEGTFQYRDCINPSPTCGGAVCEGPVSRRCLSDDIPDWCQDEEGKISEPHKPTKEDVDECWDNNSDIPKDCITDVVKGTPNGTFPDFNGQCGCRVDRTDTDAMPGRTLYECTSETGLDFNISPVDRPPGAGVMIPPTDGNSNNCMFDVRADGRPLIGDEMEQNCFKCHNPKNPEYDYDPVGCPEPFKPGDLSHEETSNLKSSLKSYLQQLKDP